MVIQLLLALGYKSIVSSFRKRKTVNKDLALLGCLLIGSLFGLLAYWIYPTRIFHNSTIPGISLFVSPVIVGFIMKTIGERKIQKGKQIIILSTFWGGALFAFGFSLVRFLLLNIT